MFLLGNGTYNFGPPCCSRACMPRWLLEWKYIGVIASIQKVLKFAEWQPWSKCWFWIGHISAHNTWLGKWFGHPGNQCTELGLEVTLMGLFNMVLRDIESCRLPCHVRHCLSSIRNQNHCMRLLCLWLGMSLWLYSCNQWNHQKGTKAWYRQSCREYRGSKSLPRAQVRAVDLVICDLAPVCTPPHHITPTPAPILASSLSSDYHSCIHVTMSSTKYHLHSYQVHITLVLENGVDSLNGHCSMQFLETLNFVDCVPHGTRWAFSSIHHEKCALVTMYIYTPKASTRSFPQP